ncbi:aspartate aminotransferase, partial [mine drainage metagenome]
LDLWIAYDNAYSEVTFGGDRAPSLLEIPGARERTVEFHSFSKTFGMAGWRLGFAVGAADLVAPLVALKSQVDSGASRPLQRAAVAALDLYRGAERPPDVQRSVDEYARRMTRLVEGLRDRGYAVEAPRGTLYLWQRAPHDDAAGFAARLLADHGVLVTPGSAFGERGAAFVRWSVTNPLPVIEAALERLPRAPISGDGPRSATDDRSGVGVAAQADRRRSSSARTSG